MNNAIFCIVMAVCWLVLQIIIGDTICAVLSAIFAVGALVIIEVRESKKP